jgi:hypothetical protein
MLVLAWALGACGHGSPTAPPPERHDGATPSHDAAVADLPAQPLGLADVAAFGWRKRAGHTAYRTAVRAEARSDWPAVVAACREALAADPGHLDAAYLLAVGLAKTGQLADVLAPLRLAAAGDFGKWGEPSLEQPAFVAFLATAPGQAWQRRVDRDREIYVGVLAHAVILIAAGDVYAFDPDAPRWYRLTDTRGAVVAVYRPPHTLHVPLLGYVTRTHARAAKDRRFAIGFVHLGDGRMTAPVDLGTGEPIHVAWSSSVAGVIVKTKTAVYAFDGAGKLVPAAAHADYPSFVAGETWLDVGGRHASIRHGPLGYDTKADWDDQGLASAMRLATSNRIVTVPSPGLIDGYTVTWSRDRSHVAFVAQLDDHCVPSAPNTAAFLADAATGALLELGRAKGGMAVEWVSDTRLAVTGDHDVELVELGKLSQPLHVAGADGLVTPRVKPRCTPEPEPPDEEPAEPGNDDPR